MWNLSGFLCKNPKCRAEGPCVKAILVLNCAILAVAPTEILFSLLRSYQALSNQLTCDKDPDIRQTSQPNTAGKKLPKGPVLEPKASS